MSVARSVLPVLVLAGMLAARGAAQSRDVVSQLDTAMRLERDGRYVEAAAAYQAVLRRAPASAGALLGLERVLAPLGRLEAITPYVAAAVEAAPEEQLIRELQFRVAGALGGPDSVAAVVATWAAAVPDSPEPYRQWAFWLARRGDLAAAQQVLAEGRARVGDARLAHYTAQLLVASGEWLEATRMWRAAALGDETLIPSAGAGLRQAPVALHQQVLAVILSGPGAQPALRRLAAEVLAEWGRAEEAWVLLDSALPGDRSEAIAALRRFADRVRRLRTAEGLRARGYALERLAGLAGGSEGARARLEAAQAFADAGELSAAERLLRRLPEGETLRSGRDAAAIVTLIRVLADAGRVDEAEAHFGMWSGQLTAGDREVLRVRLARVRLVRGELEEAEGLLGRDSSVAAHAVRGWIAVYRGELARARAHFRAAGPHALSPEQATDQSVMLVLLERIGVDRDRAIGAALLRLARGDTVQVVAELQRAARRLPALGGRADLLVFAGELAVADGAHSEAVPLFRAALAADSAGPAAPSAHLGLARALVALGRAGDAIEQLERVILAFPESAVLPRARRLLDQVRGMIPQS